MTSSYLPLVAGLMAPILVLAVVVAGRKASDKVHRRRAARRVKTGVPARPEPPPRRLLPIVSVASAVLFVVAGVAFAVDRGVVFNLTKPKPSPTVPPADPRVQVSGPAQPPSRAKRAAKPANQRKPRAVDVSVVNAAGIQGLAARKSELLRDKKVKLKTVGNAPATREESVVYFTRRSARHARRIGRLLEIRRVEPATPQVAEWGRRARVIVVLGAAAAP